MYKKRFRGTIRVKNTYLFKLMIKVFPSKSSYEKSSHNTFNKVKNLSQVLCLFSQCSTKGIRRKVPTQMLFFNRNLSK